MSLPSVQNAPAKQPQVNPDAVQPPVTPDSAGPEGSQPDGNFADVSGLGYPGDDGTTRAAVDYSLGLSGIDPKLACQMTDVTLGLAKAQFSSFKIPPPGVVNFRAPLAPAAGAAPAPAAAGAAPAPTGPAPAPAAAPAPSTPAPAPAGATPAVVAAPKPAAAPSSGSSSPHPTTQGKVTDFIEAKGVLAGPTSNSEGDYGSTGESVASLQNGLIKGGFMDPKVKGQSNDGLLGVQTKKGYQSLRDQLVKDLGDEAPYDLAKSVLPDASLNDALETYTDGIAKNPPLFARDPKIDNFLLGKDSLDVAASAPSVKGQGTGKVHSRGPAPKAPPVDSPQVDNPPKPDPKTADPKTVVDTTSTDWSGTAQTAGLAQRNDPVTNNILSSLGESVGAGSLSDATKSAIVRQLVASKDNAPAMASLLADSKFYKGTTSGQVAATNLVVTSDFKKLDAPGQRDLIASLYNADDDKAKILTQLPSTSGFSKMAGASDWEGKFRKTILSGANQEVVNNLKQGGDMPAFAYTAAAGYGRNDTVNALLISKAQALGSNSAVLQQVTSVPGFSNADPIVQSALVRGAGQYDPSSLSVGTATLSGNKLKLMNDSTFWAMLPGDQAKFAASVSSDTVDETRLTETYPQVEKILSSKSYQRMSSTDRSATFTNLMAVSNLDALGPMAGQVQQGKVPTLA